MTVVNTAGLVPNSLSTPETLQVYCGLDCCVTWEVRQALDSNRPPAIYSFERALQAPYLEIMNRGFSVDLFARHQASRSLRERISALQDKLNRMALGVWDKGLNPRSPDQCKSFFYSALNLPEVWLRQKGESKLSTNREALEKLEQYIHARPFVAVILAIRDLTKQLQIMDQEIDDDQRFRTSYNIAGTETGRPSSSKNAFGTGGNAQNIAPGLRYIYRADPGKKLCVIDLEQVEARDVGWFTGLLFGDWSFLDSCESGDLHTNNAKLIWPELPWTGDPKLDKAIAGKQFYREFSFRDMAKRGSHLSNYSGTAWTASRALKVPLPVMEEFQARYCRGRSPGGKLPAIQPAFPAIPRWWQWTAQQVQTTHSLTTPFGRKRHFFGRPNDDATIREAIAFLPQSTTADRMNLGLWRVWKKMPEVELLAQTYDSITFQYDSRQEDRVIHQALELIRVELIDPASGRVYCVPGEAKIGWNWGNAVGVEDQERAAAKGLRPPHLNLAGLIKWNPNKPDLRSEPRPL